MTMVEFLGGPRDGDIIPWAGWEQRVVIQQSRRALREPPSLAAITIVPRYVYAAQQDVDGRWFYVLRGAER